MFFVPRDNWTSRGRGLVGTPGAAIFSPFFAPIGSPYCTTAAAQVATGRPVNLAAPVVSGSTVQSQVLTTSNGTWSQPVTSYAYKWQNSPDGSTWTDIGGATSQSYTTGAGDVGKYVRSGVQATNSFGADLAGYIPSAAVGPITSSGGASPSLDFSQSGNSQYLGIV